MPQKRHRQLIIGVRGDLPGFFSTEIAPAPRAFPGTPLGPAIGDLPPLAAGKGEEDADYDLERRRRHLARWGKVARRYLYRVAEVAHSSDLTAHRARPHSERDLRDFALLREGESSAVAMRELPMTHLFISGSTVMRETRTTDFVAHYKWPNPSSIQDLSPRHSSPGPAPASASLASQQDRLSSRVAPPSSEGINTEASQFTTVRRQTAPSGVNGSLTDQTSD